MEIIKSVRPSGTYVQMRLIRPYRFKETEGDRPVGFEFVADSTLADYLSSSMIAAILVESN